MLGEVGPKETVVASMTASMVATGESVSSGVSGGGSVVGGSSSTKVLRFRNPTPRMTYLPLHGTRGVAFEF